MPENQPTSPATGADYRRTLRRAAVWCVLLFIGLTLLVQYDRSQTVEYLVLDFAESIRNDTLTNMMAVFDLIGWGFPLLAMLGVCLIVLHLMRSSWSDKLFLVWMLAGSALLNGLLKMTFRRERPDMPQLLATDGFSYPSAHTMAAFGLYITFAVLLSKQLGARWQKILVGFLAGSMVLAMGFSRVYIGVHYPTDILAGFAACSALLLLSLAVWPTLLARADANRRGKGSV